MIGVRDWEKTKERYIEFWNRENHGRPLFGIRGFRGGKPPELARPESLEQMWTDSGFITANARKTIESRVYGGESFPIVCADLGPDLFGAIVGGGIEFAWDTSWARRVCGEDDWEALRLGFDEDNPWWKLIDGQLADIARDSRGDYLVGFADWHGGCDALVSLFGPEAVSLALYDHSAAVKRLTMELYGVFREVMARSHERTKHVQQGTTHWTGLWHPGMWYSTSCDFNILLSPRMFEEFVLPELELELEFLEASIYHLDGPGAFRHLDRLLELPKLNGIQLVYGSGAPPAVHWLPELKRIQAARKCIHITCKPSELGTLLRELTPEGLFLDIQPEGPGGPFTAGDVNAISEKICSYRRKSAF